MSPMKHTKSPSGRTHRLTDRHGQFVELRYRESPQFDDQVQGDLIRKYRAETGSPATIGILPVYVDAALLDRNQSQPSPDYLRGFLAGLTTPQGDRQGLIQRTQEQIEALEAAEAAAIRGYATQAENITSRTVQRSPQSRLSRGVAAVKDAERRGW